IPRSGRGFEIDGALSPLLPLVHRFRVARFDADRTTRAADVGFAEPKERIVSDTGELVWHAAGKGKNYLTIDTPRLAAALGWIGGKTIETKAVRFEVNTPFCAVSAASLDGRPLREASKILLVAAARCANTGMKWNTDRSSISDRWGGPPILIEPVEGQVGFYGHGTRQDALVSVALDGRGMPSAGQVYSRNDGDGAHVVPLRPDAATVWYAVTAHR
ncbi:hypothetical protein AMJ85_06570, partial [candidate division BRC1 bacterium SM23_51]